MSSDRPEWPTEEPDAATLIRYAVGDGLFFLGLMNFHVKAVIRSGDDQLTMMRYISAVGRVQSACDMVLALKAIVAVDPAAADELAAGMWGAAESGDVYGELLWEWATQTGLDPDAIRAAGEAAAKVPGP